VSADARVPGSAWAWVLVLCLAQVVSTMDRGMLALVIDPVRADLGISELQVALLLGFAFALFYVSAGLPMGLLADRVDRRRLLIGGIAVWSLATFAGGLAQGFGQMFASRLFVGIGEAVLAPCAVTLISDAFPARARGRPMAVYMYGSMTAYGVGSLLSGYVLLLAPRGAFDAIAPLQGLAPWRIAFLFAGLSGLLVILLLLPLREPARAGTVAGTAAPPGTRETLAFFVDRRRLFLPLYGALAAFAMGVSVATSWGAALLTRRYGFDPSEAGKALGTGKIACATLGALVAAVLVDRVARRAGPRGKVLLAAAVALCAIPSTLAAFAGSETMAVVLIAEVTLASAVFGATMLSVVPEVTPLGARGFAVSLYAFSMTMIGGSLGPLAVATLTERVFGDPAAVGRSMAIVGCVTLVAASMLTLVAARALPRGAS
jgi:MFS family permease